MTLASQLSWFLHPPTITIYPLKGEFMFDAFIEFITALVEAISGLFSGLSSGSSAPDVTPPETTTPEVPEPTVPVEPTPEPEVPGQEPLPDAATNPEDPRLN